GVLERRYWEQRKLELNFGKLFLRHGPGVKLAPQPRLGDSQLRTNPGKREAQHAGGLFRRHSAEEAHFDQLCFERVVGFERLQRVVDADDHGISLQGSVHELVERENDLSGAAFRRVAGAGVVGQNLAHDVRGDAEKVGAALEVRLAGINQAKVSFVDQRGGLQGVADALLPEIVSGEFAQFGVDLWQEPVEGGLVAFSQILQSDGNWLRNLHVGFEDSRHSDINRCVAIKITEKQRGFGLCDSADISDGDTCTPITAVQIRRK